MGLYIYIKNFKIVLSYYLSNNFYFAPIQIETGKMYLLIFSVY